MATFLIVDGDRNFRETLAIALRLDGHEASAAATVEDAGAQLAGVRFDGCAVDVHLPGADALLEAAAKAGVRTLAMGRYPELLEASAARHPGAGMLAKPFRAADLEARILGVGATAA